MTALEVHPAAELFPLMTDAELAALAEDIAANGQRETIKLLAGAILDGRNRLRACDLANVEPRFEELPSDTDPLAYVISLNATRRNLTPSQRAIVAAEAWDFVEALPGKRARNLALLFDVNNAYVSQARALVLRAPQVAAAVKTGHLKLTVAYEGVRGTRRHDQRPSRSPGERWRAFRMASFGASRRAFIKEALVEAVELIEGTWPDERRDIARKALPHVRRLLTAVEGLADEGGES